MRYGDAMRALILLPIGLLLSGCLARTALDVVTLPVRVVGAGVDAVTTSQAEADQRAREQTQRTGQIVMPAVVVTPPVPATPKAAGVAFVDQWKYEIVDAALVPREYLMVDEKKVGGVVRSLKAETRIPGVRVYSERSVRA